MLHREHCSHWMAKLQSILNLNANCNQALNTKNQQIIPMCELLVRKRQAVPYESDADKTDEEIVEGLMEITALSLTDVLADEPAYE